MLPETPETVPQAAPPVTDRAATQRLVVRNTFYLTLAQVLAMPLSIFTMAIAGQYLGAEAFGYAYFALTLCTFGFLAVGWGHENVLPARISRDHSVANVLLGSSLAWRAVTSVIVYIILAVACYLLNYPAELQWALGLTALLTALNQFVAAYKDSIRGFERTDIPAYIHVGQQLLTAILVVIAFMMGGLLRAALLMQAAAAALTLLAVWPFVRQVGLHSLSFRWDAVKSLFNEGTPFVIFAVALALGPNVDAIFLSKLAPVEVMGWYAVSRRLVGTLLLPSTTLIGALYPTLCRLFAHDRAEFVRTANGALRGITIVAVPVALACGLFPQVGVALFNRNSFGPAEDNLRIMAVTVALIYFSMPLGTTILACGKEKAWSIVQSMTVVISLVLNPILIPIFQQRFGNGGLGLCIAGLISEVFMIGFGMGLAPAGVVDGRLWRLIGLTCLSGGAMALTAFVAKPLGIFVAVPASFAAYGAAMWVTGGIDRNQINSILGSLGGRFRRAAPAANASEISG